MLDKTLTRTQNLDAVSALDFNEKLPELIYILTGDSIFSFDGVQSYDNLVMTNAPTLSALTEEFNEMKSGFNDEINAYFDKLEAQAPMQARIDALLDKKSSAVRASSVENADKEYERILDELDDAALALIEAEDILIESEKDFQGDLESAAADIKFGIETIATLSLYNRRNGVTPVQSAAIMGSADVQQIVGLLQVGALNDARTLIAALDLTGLEPVTETERTAILAKLDAYLP